jgi:hypothetical protein
MSGHSSFWWFIGIAAVAVGAWAAGRHLGRRSGPAGWAGLTLGFLLILFWAWLVRHPATAIHLVPVRVLSRIEGVGGLPWFMLILGVAWGRSRCARQRHVIAWAMMLGAIHFMHGSRWLLQETPTAVMGQTVNPYTIRQSQDYSCVPAACATALNLLGVRATEAQLAELTLTRPGTGATIIRAFDGLDQRLRGTGWRPVLAEPGVHELRGIPTPALTPLQFEPTRRHMVVISRVLRDGAWVMDPTDGYLFLSNEQLADLYCDQLIYFVRR